MKISPVVIFTLITACLCSTVAASSDSYIFYANVKFYKSIDDSDLRGAAARIYSLPAVLAPRSEHPPGGRILLAAGSPDKYIHWYFGFIKIENINDMLLAENDIDLLKSKVERLVKGIVGPGVIDSLDVDVRPGADWILVCDFAPGGIVFIRRINAANELSYMLCDKQGRVTPFFLRLIDFEGNEEWLRAGTNFPWKKLEKESFIWSYDPDL